MFIPQIRECLFPRLGMIPGNSLPFTGQDLRMSLATMPKANFGMQGLHVFQGLWGDFEWVQEGNMQVPLLVSKESAENTHEEL